MVKKKSVKKGGIRKVVRASFKSKKKVSGFTIHFMPYSEIAGEGSLERIKKIMGIILDNKIIILQGRLKADEEVRLIENSMLLIGNVKGFQGIEIATISGEGERGVFSKIRQNLAKILVGERDSITIIGPATIVKNIKRDPEKLELMLSRK